MKSFLCLVLWAMLCINLPVTAQDKKSFSFKKLTPADFSVSNATDSGASAVIIADVGHSSFEGNLKGYFSLVYKRTRRIMIVNKNGFTAAKVEIPLYSNNNAEEKLEDLKAFTSNLENGKVVETKLDGASVFKDKLSAHYINQKFTFPAVKEGSIIEYSYTIKSDFLFNLQPWEFQSEYPCLYSEYEVSIPEFFQYVTLSQGTIQPDIKTSSFPEKFRVTIPGGADRSELVTVSGEVNTRRWILKDIPALKEENFTSAIKNYVSRIEFQLARIQFEGGQPQDLMGNWVLLSEKLMANDNFGASLTRNNNWLDTDLKELTKNTTLKLEKAKKIFAFVRDNFTCTDHSALYMQASLKEAYKKHSGCVADINLLLTAMLRHEGIAADPLILSTKENGFTNQLYPLVDRFNYVVCQMDIDGVLYDLDASSPYNGFAMLPPDCYNGHARLITKAGATPVYFEADSLKEHKVTTVFIANDEKGGMAGSFKSQLGYYESFNLRKKLKGECREFMKNIKPGNGFELSLSDAGIDSLKIPDLPAAIHYDFSFKPADEDIIYLNPMMAEGYKANPFTSAERKYPVEMPYTMDEVYVLSMEIPKGYTVEEIPKSARVMFNEDEGQFEYLIQKSAESIQLRTRVRLNKAVFTPEDYNSLRDFFAVVVKKQNEQIVLKKK